MSTTNQKPPLDRAGLDEMIEGLRGGHVDRRTVLRKAAGFGLTFPVIGALGLEVAKAQDDDEHEHDPKLGTPESG